MHAHAGLPLRTFSVVLMDIDQVVLRIEVESPCDCDMWDFVMTLDLPIIPAFMDIKEKVPAVK